ncbi:tripartite tricarboxylate transporter substrate binding protein [Roseococcus sp. SDR]|uniref:Bug family tripartite tricarboxylate transporter substrate binding protein n=1 Tax=Roseococcus sp. SDR TaxID=2835532 RepID=UPI001BCF2649|nr:tripartite tricarboxylate transporter substrate binding protein [Roseococcus sp. SDR]MBS7790705.1 tripartite tricarboxylate transporter substrate binding protein [Roseococcus sp. SDR]MBV1846019.1 tripartite tricarboxylate transporter substrate binding protein [Roseococcus sp. SDR]
MTFPRRSLLASPLALPALATAQTVDGWPNRPVRLVIAFAAGGALDAIARSMGRHMEREYGQPFVTDARSGAGGRIGTAHVGRSPGDGYTLLVTSSAAHGVAPGLYPDLPYHPMNDFTHIGLVGTAPMVLLTSGNAPYRDLAGLVASARARGTPVNFGSPGIGSLGHLTGELAGRTLGIPVQHVSYRGSAPAQLDMLAGQLELVSDNPSSHSGPMQAGRIRCLAVAAPQRMAAFPDAPTWAEQGFPQMVASAWYGFSGPAGMPPALVTRLNASLAAWLATAEAQELLRGMAMQPEGRMSSAQYTAFVASEVARWAQVARDANVRVEG